MKQLTKTLSVSLMFWVATAIAPAAPAPKQPLRRAPARPAVRSVMAKKQLARPAARKPVVRYSSSYRYSTKSKTVSRYTPRSKSKRVSTGRYTARRGGRRVSPRHYTRVGQQAPTAERIVEIQRALADKGYLLGDLDGKWDARTIEALRRFQADQSLTADGKLSSMSLIALGLGPARTRIALARMSVPPPGRPAPAAPFSSDSTTVTDTAASFGLSDLRDLQ